ncbi:MAG: cytochrome c oxidase assembly protein [Acidimicrobiales bacterium]
MGTPGPYAWDPHLPAWVTLVAGVGVVVAGHRRLVRTGRPPIPWTRRQIVTFGGACVASVVALTWPVADLAAHWSLVALVTQRLILLLAVAPMLLLGLPYDVLQWITRPAPVDMILTQVQRPLVAIATVTVLVIGSMTPVMVRAEASSPVARGVLDLVIVVAGLVLWIPVLGRIPGLTRPKPVIRFGYLVAQAVVPAFLSFIYIFSRRPLYPEFARSHAAIGLRPLNDQQISGFVSKLTLLFVLLTVGAVVLARAPRSEEEIDASETLVWADVERQFERVDRQSARDRTGRAGPPVEPDPPHPQPGPGPGSVARPEDDSIAGPSPDDERSDRSKGGAEPPDGTQPER